VNQIKNQKKRGDQPGKEKCKAENISQHGGVFRAPRRSRKTRPQESPLQTAISELSDVFINNSSESYD